jgi:hypothetical protein
MGTFTQNLALLVEFLKASANGNIQFTGTSTLGGNGLVFPDGSLQYAAASGKNKVVNGDCRVQQYPSGIALASAAGSGYGGVDRYKATNSGATGGAFTQSAGTISIGGISYPAVVQTVNTVPTALTGINYFGGIQTLIEGYNVYDLLGGNCSLRFLFFATVAGTYSICLYDFAAGYSYVTSFVATAGAQLVQIQNIPVSLSLALASSTASGLGVSIGFLNLGTYLTSTLNVWQSGIARTAAGSTNWAATIGNQIAVSDLQLEAGPVCTPMERKLFSASLADCMRYYEYQPSGQFAAGGVNGATVAYLQLHFQPKRVTPSSITSAAANQFTIWTATTANIQPSALSFNAQNSTSALVTATIAGGVAGQAAILENNGSSWVAISAEI